MEYMFVEDKISVFLYQQFSSSSGK